MDNKIMPIEITPKKYKLIQILVELIFWPAMLVVSLGYAADSVSALLVGGLLFLLSGALLMYAKFMSWWQRG